MREYAEEILKRCAEFINLYFYSHVEIEDVWTCSYYRGSTTYVRIGPILLSSSCQYEKTFPDIQVIIPGDAKITPILGDSCLHILNHYRAFKEGEKVVHIARDQLDNDALAFIDKEIIKKTSDIEKILNDIKAQNLLKKMVYMQAKENEEKSAIEEIKKFI